MKAIGIGLNKTGTKTLGQCFQFWGFKHITYNKKAFRSWCLRDYESLMKWVSNYNSFEDWPWPLIYREIDMTFPGSKFILTRRKDPETWFESLCKHAERTGPTDYRKSIYGYYMPHDHKEEFIRFYSSHNASVREYFQNRPKDLLEVCWEEGDGWEKLANFIGVEPPDLPFPHTNKR